MIGGNAPFVRRAAGGEIWVRDRGIGAPGCRLALQTVSIDTRSSLCSPEPLFDHLDFFKSAAKGLVRVVSRIEESPN